MRDPYILDFLGLRVTMSQDDTPDLAASQAGKVAPEAVALRAQPHPVTRL